MGMNVWNGTLGIMDEKMGMFWISIWSEEFLLKIFVRDTWCLLANLQKIYWLILRKMQGTTGID